MRYLRERVELDQNTLAEGHESGQTPRENETERLFNYAVRTGARNDDPSLVDVGAGYRAQDHGHGMSKDKTQGKAR